MDKVSVIGIDLAKNSVQPCGADARAGLANVLQSGLIAPFNGNETMSAIESSRNPGLLDRLIAGDYRRAGLESLTLDRKMAALPAARRL